MGLLPRVSKLVLGIVVLLALVSLPSLRSERTHGSALTPQIAWAGGSPDETLNPKKSPGVQQPAPAPGEPIEGNALRASGTGRAGLTVQKRWEIYYRVFRIFAQRLI